MPAREREKEKGQKEQMVGGRENTGQGRGFARNREAEGRPQGGMEGVGIRGAGRKRARISTPNSLC